VRLTQAVLDPAAAATLAEELSELARTPTPRQLLLDLSGVEYLPTSVLGGLVALHKQLRQVGGELVVCNADGTAYEVLKLARLAEVLAVRPAGT
jgi:anti-anti-sigma factor